MAFDPKAVANEILRLAWAEGRTVTPLQLVKLTYISHGWHLALNDAPLINQPVQAWKWGPVVPSVYREFKEFGREPVTMLATEGWADPTPYELKDVASPESEESASLLVRRVWDSYKHLSGVQLSAITHQSGTPWAVVTKDGTDIGEFKIIPDDLIKEHYNRLKEERGVQS